MSQEMSDVTSYESTHESNENILSSISGYLVPITNTISDVVTSNITSISFAVSNAFDSSNFNVDPLTELSRERLGPLKCESVVTTQPLPVLNDQVNLASSATIN